ncbi:MAG: sigma-70 family RNA polymerase sigma factor [Chloroflexota bacterium]|nr:sigma-70 family RNA polymerase sigma factor [Chloroflexota bacterium]
MRIFRSEGSRREPVVAQNAPPAAELSDEALIHAIAAKEVWAMDQLYERYNRLLYSLAFRMVSDHQIAEDLLQESFLSVWRNAASYARQMGEVRSWLVSIIHHRTIDYLRAMRRRAGLNQATLDDVERDESVATPDVWDEAWMSIQGAQVRDALTKLSQEQRKVIEMGYFQGWTHSEIAEGLQLPLGTVKARMRLGLMHLKRILQQMGVDGL